MHTVDFSQPVLTVSNYLILVADADKITDNFTFLHFEKQFMPCSSSTPNTEKG